MNLKFLSRTLPCWSQPVVLCLIFGRAGSLLLLWTFCSCGEHGLLSSLLAVVWASHCGGFSLLQSTGSRAHRLSNCGSRALLPHCLWNLPGPGIKLMSRALVDGFLITRPPGKPLDCHFLNCINLLSLEIPESKFLFTLLLPRKYQIS